MAEKNHTYQIISVILLIAVITFAGLYFTKSVPNCPEVNEELCSAFITECPQVEEKAMLKVETAGWFVNLYDETEMFFDYWIYNFGDKEAKNIKVKCKLYDENYNLLTSVTDNFGNLASNSGEFGEVYTDDVMEENKEYVGLCYVESCDNCEILYKRIPDLVESYESD